MENEWTRHADLKGSGDPLGPSPVEDGVNMAALLHLNMPVSKTAV